MAQHTNRATTHRSKGQAHCTSDPTSTRTKSLDRSLARISRQPRQAAMDCQSVPGSLSRLSENRKSENRSLAVPPPESGRSSLASRRKSNPPPRLGNLLDGRLSLPNIAHRQAHRPPLSQVTPLFFREFLKKMGILMDKDDVQELEEVSKDVRGGVTVSLVRCKRSGRIMAQKTFHLPASEASPKRLYIHRELRILAACRSPFIVTCFGAYYLPDASTMTNLCVCMEYMNCRSLDIAVKRADPPHLPEQVLQKVAQSFAGWHSSSGVWSEMGRWEGWEWAGGPWRASLWLGLAGTSAVAAVALAVALVFRQRRRRAEDAGLLLAPRSRRRPFRPLRPFWPLCRLSLALPAAGTARSLPLPSPAQASEGPREPRLPDAPPPFLRSALLAWPEAEPSERSQRTQTPSSARFSTTSSSLPSSLLSDSSPATSATPTTSSTLSLPF